MENFNKYFTFEQFMVIAESSLYNTMNKDKTPIDIPQLKKGSLLIAIHDFLYDYNKENSLAPIANSTGHSTNFGYFWNNFINNNINKKGYTKEENLKADSIELGQLLSKELFFPFYVNKNDIKKIDEEPEFWRNRYTELIGKINEGNFEHYMLPDSSYCFECGTNFKLEFKQWNPQLIEMVLVHKDENWMKDKYEYNPAPDCAVPNKISLEVEFTSGKLLITDWWRIPQFTKIVDPKDVYDEKDDVNCSLGRINQAKRYANNFNFISTPSGGMPNIFKNGNDIIIGNYDEDDRSKNLKTFEKKYDNIGRVDCQLRAITVIDYDQLVKLLMLENNTKDEVEKIIKEYMENNKREIINMEVKPGKYTFEFSGKHHNLKKHIEENLPSAITPFLILKDTDSYNNTIKNTVNKKSKVK